MPLGSGERAGRDLRAPRRAARRAPRRDAGAGPPAPRRDDQRACPRSRRRDAARRPARRGGSRRRAACASLHDASFTDDPTRLWRVARYAARLGFAIEQRTAELAAEAVAGGALGTVSGPRIGNELRLALAEPDPVAALDAAVAIGAAPWLAPDRALTERAIGLLAPGEGRRDLLVLAAALPAPADDALLARLEFTAAERAIVRASVAAPALGGEDPPARGPPPRSPARCATCPSRRSRWPARAARRSPRAAGWTSCATSRCRSPAPTCWRRASRRGRTSAGACRPCSTSASTARSRPAARRSWRPRCRPRRGRAHRDAVLQMS